MCARNNKWYFLLYLMTKFIFYYIGKDCSFKISRKNLKFRNKNVGQTGHPGVWVQDCV